MLASDHSLAGQPRDADPFHLEVGNPREFLQAEKESANGPSRIASSAGVTCIYLSQKLAEIDDPMIRLNGGIAAGDGPWAGGRLGASESLGRV